MPTDAFEVADSQDTDFNGGVTGARLKAGPFASLLVVPILDSIKTALIAAGWAEGTPTHPRSSITLPYGLPVIHAPLVPLDEEDKPATSQRPMLTFQAQKLVMYDPTREIPGVDVHTTYVPMGGTIPDSFENLTDAIDSDTVYTVADYGIDGSGHWFIDVVANTPGAQYNRLADGGQGYIKGRVFWAAPRYQPGEGGWVLRSTDANGGWLEVWMYLPIAVKAGHAAFEFRSSTGGGTPTYYLPGAKSNTRSLPSGTWKYSVIANQFQFAVFANEGRLDFLFASLPYLENGCEYGALILFGSSGQNARGALEWFGINGGWASARDGELTPSMSFNNFRGCYPGIYALRSQAAIKTTQGFPITQSAWLGLPAGRSTDASGQSRIVGKLWDALILSETKDLDSSFSHRGLLWQCIFSSRPTKSYTKASVWIAYSDQP